MSIIYLIIFSAILKGKVFDTSQQLPLQAHVCIKDENQIYFCDTSGAFLFRFLNPGSHTLIVSHIGFKEETLMVDLYENTITYLNIGLNPLSIFIEPVEVWRERAGTTGTKSLEQSETITVPGAERDIFKVIQTLPGVSTPTDYLGLLYVRGGESYENQVTFDNIEIMMPYHYFGVGSVFNTDMIESFEFLASAFPARYGNALSSIINIKSKKPKTLITANASCDPMEANWYYSCPLNRQLFFTFSSKRNYLDLLLENLGIGKDMVLPYYSDQQGKIEFYTGVSTFSIAGLKSSDKMVIKSSLIDENLYLSVDNKAKTLAFTWTIKVAENSFANIIYNYSDMSRYLHGEIPAYGGTTEIIEKQKNGLDVNFTLDMSNLKFDIGGGHGNFRFLHNGQKIEDLFYGINIFNYWFDFDTTDSYSYVFLSQSFNVLSPISCELGERIEWFPVVARPVFSPRIRINYRIKPLLFISYGHQHQIPPLEYSLEVPNTMYAKCLTVGLEHYLKPAVLLNIELYQKKYYNLVQLRDTFVSCPVFENDGSGYAYGAEVSLRKFRMSDNFGWISYAFSLSKRSSPYCASPSEFFAQRPHIINVVFGRVLKKSVEMNMKFVIASGPAWYEVIGRTWNGWQWLPLYAPNKTQLPTYQRFDIHIQKSFNFSNLHGEFYITILNLLNHRNVQGYFYNSDYTMRKAFYMMPLIPLLGIRLVF